MSKLEKFVLTESSGRESNLIFSSHSFPTACSALTFAQPPTIYIFCYDPLFMISVFLSDKGKSLSPSLFSSFKSGQQAELAYAFYDLNRMWHIIPTELYLRIWQIQFDENKQQGRRTPTQIFLCCGLFGNNKFPVSTRNDRILRYQIIRYCTPPLCDGGRCVKCLLFTMLSW